MIITRIDNKSYMVTKPSVRLKGNELKELQYDLKRKVFGSSRFKNFKK